MKYDRFVGYDYATNAPITETFHPVGDDAHNAMRSEEAADISNWNRMLYENAYNDPSQQLKRMLDAGLNPLFYLGGNAGTTPSASAPGAQSSAPGSKSGKLEQLLQAVNTANQMVDTGLSYRKQMMDYDVAKEANAIARQNADTQRMLVNAQVPNIQSEQDFRDYYLTSKTQKEMSEITARINTLVTQGKLNEASAKQAEANTKYLATLDRYYDQMVGVAGSQRKLNYAMAEYYGSQKSYTDMIAEPMAKKLQEEAGLTKEEARKVALEATNAIYSGAILQYQGYLIQKYGDQEKISQILEAYAIGANQGMSAINTGVNTFFNVTSGGLYGAGGNAAPYQGFYQPSVRNPIGYGRP